LEHSSDRGTAILGGRATCNGDASGMVFGRARTAALAHIGQSVRCVAETRAQRALRLTLRT
jgi:hypothetical protein